MFGWFRRKKIDSKSIINEMHKCSKKYIDSVLEANPEYKKEDFDYSEKSLEIVDKLLNRYYETRAELTRKEHLYCSAYVMECARNEFGGGYKSLNNENPYVLAIANIGFEIGFCAMEKVHGRVRNGSEDNLVFFYQGIRPYYEKQVSAIIV